MALVAAWARVRTTVTTDANETVLTIEGMTCSHCVKHVAEALRAIDGVSEVEVLLEAGRARIRHRGTAVASLLAAVEEAGYEARALDNA